MNHNPMYANKLSASIGGELIRTTYALYPSQLSLVPFRSESESVLFFDTVVIYI